MFRRNLIPIVAIVLLIALTNNARVIAQSFGLPVGTYFTNMLVSQGPVPGGTGCTITPGSTDASGSCLTTAASGSIAFGKLPTAYTVAPNCVVVDRSATPLIVYSVSTTLITLTTMTAAHNLSWHCDTPAY